MLADGRISHWERRPFLASLEQEATLDADQRARVLRLLDSWSGQDARAGAV